MANRNVGRTVRVSLADRIELTVAERAGIYITVEETGGALILNGRVDTEEARQAAADLAGELAPGRAIENALEVESVVPVDISSFHAGDAGAAVTPGSVGEMERMDSGVEPDFQGDEGSTSSQVMGGVELEDDEDTTYFAPTDPVLTSDDHGNVQVLGGFTPTSTDDLTVEPSASDGSLGDEAIADAVLRELREDAMTTALRIDVQVREGVVHLRGSVEGMEDADAAEAVAARVPGVREVVEELRVRAL